MAAPLGAAGAMLFLAGAAAAGPSSPFEDAVAAWHFADLRDSAGAQSDLQAVGAVEAGQDLPGAEAEASRKRGGDGKAALFRGGYLDAGQGASGELNLTGTAMSLLIRLRDPSGRWNTTLFSKHGGHGRLLYNLFTADLGGGMVLGFELGTERGMHQVKAPLAELSPSDWHDVIARYDGKLLELFVDGVPLDRRPAGGALRTANPEPCILGGESTAKKVTRPFQGLVDHAALWKRALADEEVLFLSGGREEVARRSEELAARRAAEERSLAEKLARDPQRPRYHFVPPAGWMNDPNGLIQWKGEYHLFYQHNPHGAFWGTMHWGHATSRDLVHWTHLPIALAPTPGGPDWDGVFSGCLVDDGGVPTIVYTGVSPETQCIAISRDGLLTWEKHPRNPVIPGPPPGLEVTGFRDPCVWKEPDGWYMAVGSGIKGQGGAVLLYRSKDLRLWDYLHPLCVGRKELGEMWECPNFFPLGEKHLLLVSVHGTVLYFTGRYRDHHFTVEAEGNTDYGGHFYAGQCFKDQRGRLLLFGWVTEGRGDAEQRAAGWSGAQSLPRVLSLLPDGKLGMEPAEEVRSLRGKPLPGLQAHGGRMEILARFEPDGAGKRGLLIYDPKGAARAVIELDPEKERIAIHRSPPEKESSGVLKLPPGEAPILDVFLDGSVLEVFANGRACLTSRLYFPSGEACLGGTSSGAGESGSNVTSLEVWEMKE
jgi:beta-fructofuranosidase